MRHPDPLVNSIIDYVTACGRATLGWGLDILEQCGLDAEPVNTGLELREMCDADGWELKGSRGLPVRRPVTIGKAAHEAAVELHRMMAESD